MIDCNIAIGQDLDRIAALYGVTRNFGQPDAELRTDVLKVLRSFTISFQPENLKIPEFYECVDTEIKFQGLNDVVCECGKDKHGFASHSTWCPRHL
jgi:hypothetical protein